MLLCSPGLGPGRETERPQGSAHHPRWLPQLAVMRLWTLPRGVWARLAVGDGSLCGPQSQVGGAWWGVVGALGSIMPGQADSHCVRSCGSWSIQSHPAKYLWSFPASAKCPEPSSICRPFLSFLKVNIALGERSEHAARSRARGEALILTAKPWKIPGKRDFHFPWGWGGLISIPAVYLGWKEKHGSLHVS